MPFRLLLCFLILTFPAAAQYASRAAEIEAAREAKATQLTPDEQSATERFLLAVKERKILERLTAGIAGFRVSFGGMVAGSGFALGPEYLRTDLAEGQVNLRGSARGSLKKYTLLDLGLSLPRLAGDHAFLNFHAAHRNYPQMQYYGPGPDSAKSGRSDFRLENMAWDTSGGVKPVRNLKIGASGGFVKVNVGPGTNKGFVSTERIFPPSMAPGIDRQTDFARSAVFAQYDYRDFPGGPRKGGNYVARYGWYSDRNLKQYSFRQLDLEVQQYISFFNERRVIALRGKSVLTFTDHNQVVPFYLQPTLGGAEDLRGFRPFRFYDDNMTVFNAEYRWETFSGLDMAVFADAGKVFHRRADWNVHDLEGCYGVGMRFNVQNSVFMRIDAGFSHEGFQVWLKFNNVF